MGKGQIVPVGSFLVKVNGRPFGEESGGQYHIVCLKGGDPQDLQSGVLQLTLPSAIATAANEPEWHVNATTGSDNNDGRTALTALQTSAEVFRRIGDQVIDPPFEAAYAAKPWRLFVDSTLPTSDPLLRGRLRLAQDVAMGIFGGVEQTLATGTFTAVTVKNAGGQQQWEVTDAALASWAPYVGVARIRITSGARINTIMYVQADLGAHTAKVSDPSVPGPLANGTPRLDFWQQFVTRKTPQVGDTYAIEKLFAVTQGALELVGDGAGPDVQVFQAAVGELRFRNDGGGGEWAPAMIATSGFLSAWSCIVELLANPNVFTFYMLNCLYAGAAFSCGSMKAIVGGLYHSVFGWQGGISNSTGIMHVAFNATFQGGPVQGSGVLITSASIWGCTDTNENRGGHAVHCGIQSFDLGNNNGGTGCSLSFGNFYNGDTVQELFGNGNAGAGVYVPCGGTFCYKSGLTLNVTGAGGDARMAGQTQAYPFNAATRVYDALANLTWANIVGATFNGHAHRPDLDAQIVAGI